MGTMFVLPNPNEHLQENLTLAAASAAAATAAAAAARRAWTPPAAFIGDPHSIPLPLSNILSTVPQATCVFGGGQSPCVFLQALVLQEFDSPWLSFTWGTKQL